MYYIEILLQETNNKNIIIIFKQNKLYIRK